MKIGKPKYVDQCCNKKHRSNHYQKQHRAEHLGDVKMSLWFSIRSMENLEAFHASRATSNINISSVVSTLICNVIFCLLEISGWSLRGSFMFFSLNPGGELPTQPSGIFCYNKDVVFLVWWKTVLSAIPRTCSLGAHSRGRLFFKGYLCRVSEAHCVFWVSKRIIQSLQATDFRNVSWTNCWGYWIQWKHSGFSKTSITFP